MSDLPSAVSRLQFWFEFGSTYSYLSAMRIEGLAKKAGVHLEWCPFLLGPIFAARGWPTSPFSVYPDKGRYMWRDVERRAATYGLPFQKPSVFPQNGLLAARVAIACLDEPWLPDFVRHMYTAHFGDDMSIADPDVVSRAVARAGGNPAQAIEAAASPDIKAALRKRTEDAAAYGIFGAPAFIVDGELFWGDDRLEDALAWCAGSHRQP